MVQPLGAYLSAHKMTCTDFARRIGVKDSTVWRWVFGQDKQRRSPSLRLALAIERATDGAVPVGSWNKGTTAASRKSRKGRAAYAPRS